MKFEVTLTFAVEAADADEAHQFGVAAGEHLYETFNDDDSMPSQCGVHVTEKTP
jgi:hypothetical protein